LFILCWWQGGPQALLLFQLQIRLLLDAPERAKRDVSLWVRHRHSSRFGRMLELNVASLLGNLLPTVCLQS
jgi:hypothetical protein